MEGLPTVLIEGLMLNKLIVATDCPTGPSEILDKGKSGLLVPIGDDDAMAESIHQLLTSQQLRSSVMAHLKEHRKHFMYEETLRLFDEIIKDVLKKMDR
jgi:glycosyltransferase involved in cell wall biosynthesis